MKHHNEQELEDILIDLWEGQIDIAKAKKLIIDLIFRDRIDGTATISEIIKAARKME